MRKGAARVLCWALGCAALIAAPDGYAELFAKAAALSRGGNYVGAIAKYREALALRPGAPEALSNLAVMYYAAGKYQNAWDSASQALAKQPGSSPAALIAGLAAIRLNRLDDAIAPLDRVLGIQPDNRDALLGLASARVGLGQLDAAARLYVRRTSSAPDDSDAWYGQAVAYERMAEDASRALSRMPGAAFYSKRLLGEYLLAEGGGRLAEEAFGEAEKVEGSASQEAGKEYEKSRDLAGKSREAFLRFVSLAPDSWQANVFLGDVNRQHNQLPEALGHYLKAAELQPDSPAPLLGAGTAYWELGDFEKARKALESALRIDPGALQASFELANIAVRQHRDAEAARLLKKFLQAEPDALAARADLGRAYLHLGEYAKAAEQLRLAAPVDDKGEIHYQLAQALKKLGNRKEAEAAMNRSIEIRRAALERERRLRSQP